MNKRFRHNNLCWCFELKLWHIGTLPEAPVIASVITSEVTMLDKQSFEELADQWLKRNLSGTEAQESLASYLEQMYKHGIVDRTNKIQQSWDALKHNLHQQYERLIQDFSEELQQYPAIRERKACIDSVIGTM